MQATTAQAHSQRASRVIAALHFVTTTFVMHAMVGRRSHQIKMPRQAPYPLTIRMAAVYQQTYSCLAS